MGSGCCAVLLGVGEVGLGRLVFNKKGFECNRGWRKFLVLGWGRIGDNKVSLECNCVNVIELFAVFAGVVVNLCLAMVLLGVVFVVVVGVVSGVVVVIDIVGVVIVVVGVSGLAVAVHSVVWLSSQLSVAPNCELVVDCIAGPMAHCVVVGVGVVMEADAGCWVFVCIVVFVVVFVVVCAQCSSAFSCVEVVGWVVGPEVHCAFVGEGVVM